MNVWHYKQDPWGNLITQPNYISKHNFWGIAHGEKGSPKNFLAPLRLPKPKQAEQLELNVK